ncbi:DEAD/DEAH box helicase [Treponema sp. C6A8]|uniref:DEAD/DEAH box helicase n=1 Tax=Treponema sp. C6A8 TaxID=1410609 RepID=UPI00056F652D|nr:DEAD/DEAH box helicase [Treponema sp. C6A8]
MKNAFTLLSENLNQKLAGLGIKEPTAVQNEIIPRILEKKNVIFQSETGTGKTFAYLLPLIQNYDEGEGTSCDVRNNENCNAPLGAGAARNTADGVKILIAAPTFELASQINQAAKQITEKKTALFIGGAPIKRQIETLKEKPFLVIGTPARLVELIRLKKLKISALKAIVFDETDRLVRKELFEESDALRLLVPKETQVIACTATLNKQTKIFFAGIENVVLPAEDVLRKRITHWAIYAENRDKIETLRKFIAACDFQKILIFTSRADQVENIYSKLKFKKVDCMALHAKADKQLRKAAIDKFRSGKCKILITSDLAARGLDIANISHVVQMDLPEDEDFFIHRSGRTARAGKSGINVVIGDEYEMRKYAALEKKLGIVVYPKEIYDGKIISPKMD